MEFWRTCGFPPKGGKDFDKPRCREASRSVGPAGPKASRAPSLFEASGGIAIREGLPGADIKNTGDVARVGAYPAFNRIPLRVRSRSQLAMLTLSRFQPKPFRNAA